MSPACSTADAALPPRLRPGDAVGLCAPASPVPPERLAAGVAVLARRYRVISDDGLLSSTGYLAGDDDRRADELNRHLRDPDVRAVILARGGYGILRILDRLDADALRRDPKLIVGYSDATALLAWALVVARVRPIHGPVVTHLGELGAADQQWLFRLLEDPSPPGAIAAALEPAGAGREGVVAGPLLGGNLCILSHLAGTRYQLDLGGAVVFLEEIGERPYRIDRYLTHLHLAGALGAGAALIGDLVRCVEPVAADHPAAGAVVDERLRRFSIPALSGLPVGHGDRNLALPYGARAEVDFTARRVTLLGGAVA